MKIYVVGSSKNKFQPLNDIREKFLIDEYHNGENIDFLNPWYCELTGLYWLWKNSTEDIVGLEHYRRYFVDNNNKLLSKDNINEILMTNDIICKRFIFNRCKPLTWWNRNKSMLNLFNKFINNLDEFHKICIQHFLNTAPYFAQCNMFICRKEIINEYCEWLFTELSKLNNEFKPLARSIGYIAEYIFGAWLMIHGYKIHYQNVKEYK